MAESNLVLHIYAIDLKVNDNKMYKLMQSHPLLVALHFDVVCVLVRRGNMDVNPNRVNYNN